MGKTIAILGSTGSIGTQALDVIEEHSDLYEVYCLTANNRVEQLAEQARKFKPAAVVIANEAHYERLQQLLAEIQFFFRIEHLKECLIGTIIFLETLDSLYDIREYHIVVCCPIFMVKRHLQLL